MQTVGNITGYVDLAQILLYVFWIFFAGLIWYLVRENHREGYPMESSSSGRAVVKGFPIPAPKTFLLEGGKSVTVPDFTRKEPAYNAVATYPSSGAAIAPVGNAMTAGVGPGAYAGREDVPERTSHGVPLIQPLRIASDYTVAAQDVDPRGLPVMAGDGKQGGTVKDIWIDSAEMMFRYLEVEIDGGRTVLLPITFSLIRRNQVEVHAVYARHFADVPALRNPDQVTKLEEEKISAYYGGGTLYADAHRSEPLI
ncbi:photosynthetic reaction center subunit H [Limnohabitans sp. 15K]|uniref:photosynthetic reaction center subunit H n=1 Tax=Limnohabitans sp. 15K TaxID=1100706 RepID=UPI000C1F196A|nr:photosynthetic reaction center subunit H [Limnohabitans sp. 15K]PIT83801.1 photosynthetic reaction center subunit H [Limnohabitans sp. 15K]